MAGVRGAPSGGPTLEQVEVFCRVAELGGYRAVADEVDKTPQDVSRLIKRLGTATGQGRLTHADGGRVSLTAAGEDLLPVAHRLMDAARELRSSRVQIRLCTYPSIAVRIARTMPSVLDEASPLVLHDITGSSRSDGGRGLVARLRRREVDIVIAPAGHGRAEVVEQHLYRWKLRAVTGLPSDVRGRESMTIAALTRRRLAVAPVGHLSRDLLETVAAGAARSLNVVLSSPDPYALRAIATAKQDVVAVVPDDAFGVPDTGLGPIVTVGQRKLGGAYSVYTRAPNASEPRDMRVADFAKQITGAFNEAIIDIRSGQQGRPSSAR